MAYPTLRVKGIYTQKLTHSGVLADSITTDLDDTASFMDSPELDTDGGVGMSSGGDVSNTTSVTEPVKIMRASNQILDSLKLKVSGAFENE